jgi:hypothetical protein
MGKLKERTFLIDKKFKKKNSFQKRRLHLLLLQRNLPLKLISKK